MISFTILNSKTNSANSPTTRIVNRLRARKGENCSISLIRKKLTVIAAVLDEVGNINKEEKRWSAVLHSHAQ
jgi:hypothetical protein